MSYEYGTTKRGSGLLSERSELYGAVTWAAQRESAPQVSGETNGRSAAVMVALTTANSFRDTSVAEIYGFVLQLLS